jgi:hypothetical protein
VATNKKIHSCKTIDHLLLQQECERRPNGGEVLLFAILQGNQRRVVGLSFGLPLLCCLCRWWLLLLCWRALAAVLLLAAAAVAAA